MGGVQDVVKQKLKIRWVDARKLSCQAQSDLGIQDEEEENARQDEIVKQAIAIFNLLSTQEQDATSPQYYSTCPVVYKSPLLLLC